MEKIPISDFAKLELKTGKILEVSDHPNADKLYVLKVDLGEEKPKTIVAGLKAHYKKEELKGKQAVFAANLEPAMLRGIKSDGMILAAVSNDKSKVILIKPEKEIAPGTKIS
jgi:methionyl-tRNA synthetase